MAVNTLGLNRAFPIYNADGTSFNNLELRKAVVDSIVMSLGDKITGEVYYKDNSLAVTMHEYIDYNGVRYMLVNPPTVVREGMVSDNGQLNGMTKYSFEFYHPMYLLGNIPFNDVAVTADETRYLSENAVFSWIGYPDDLIAKLNKNLQGTEWIVVKSSRFPNEKDNELSEVIPFNNAMISDVLKTFYDTWEVPFVIGQVESTEAAYAQGKRFKVIFGLPYNEIYETPEDRSGDIPFVFQFGQGVGLKNNSRNPRNNKIVTRIAGYGAERNVPYGYPQIPWYGDSRWDWTEYEGDVINYDINDKVTNNPKSTAYPIYDGIVSGQPTRLIKHPFTRTHLMPSIYGELLFNKVSPYISGGGVNPSYNPNIQLKDFYDAIATQEYPYINEINPSAPSYQFKEFEKIYPELGEEYIYGVQPLNDDLTPAPDWDDSIDNDGNYNQSYFAITLPILSFDIYASAAITEEMEINMRSGACLGCTFQVQVDWEDYKNNFFNSDGEFDPVPHTAENDGHVRDAKKYPDSSQTRVTVIVKKDLETFGTLMPNVYQYPIAGDQFVVLGISMPQSYISNAEARLDVEMKTYMLENNVYYFDYPLKFDEKFLRDNTYILSQLRPNSIVRFNYAGQQLQLYVKQLTVKYGEKPLPQYDITLTDNVEVVLNQLGQVADDVERLSTLISIVRENYSRSVWAELAKKLSKVDDDTAQGTIRFLKGLQVGSRFVSGLLGSGGIFRRNADGKTYLETDNLYVRMKAYFDTVEVREYEHSHGGRIASSAGQKVSHVVKMGYYPEGSQTKVPLDDDNYYHYIDPATGDETLIPLDVCCYRCYYRAKENRDTTEQATRQNTFKRGDMARCHMVNDSLNQKDYWRIVDETNEYDTFYNGEYGWTDLTNEAHFDVTGTSTCWGYMGASSGEAADVPEMGDDLYQLGSVTDADRQGAIVEATTGNDTPAYRIYQSVGKDLRPTPAQGQPPLSEFDPFTLEDRDYINLFYNSATGRAQMDVYGDAYIGAKDSSTYINYNAGTRRLNIKAIVDIAGGFLDGGTQKTFDQLLSGRTYTQAQVDAMIEGIQEQIDGEIDTWFYDYMPVDFDATEPANKVPLLFYEKDGVSYPCQPYYDWFVADHGDPTTTPITQPTTDVERNKHLGDIFYDNTSGYAFRFSKDENTGDFEWVEITDSAVIKALRDAANAQDTADNKRRVFVAQPAPIPPKTYVEYDVGDLWTNANFTGSDSHSQAVVYSNDLLRCITAKPIRDAQGNITDGTFSIDDWQLASKYTDDSTLLTFLDGYQGNLTNIRTQVDRKAETWRQATDPSTVARPNGWLGEQDSEHVGDIWMDTSQNGGNKTKIFQDKGDSASPRYAWEEQAVPDEVFDEIDGKAALYTDYDDWYDSINNVNNLQIRDLYIPYRNYPIESTDAAATYKTNKVYRCTYAGDYTRNPVTPPTFQEIAYTNDDVFNGYISQVLNGTGATGDSAVVANAIRAIKGALNEGTLVDGGLVLTGFIGLRQNGLLWSGMSGQYDSLQTTGGIAAWYGGGFVDYETLTDAQKSQGWNVIRWARSLFRFDGSGYLADGNITWDKNGNIAIRDITTLLDGNNTDILNELVTFNNAFHFSTQQGSTTVLSISPQAGFTSLNITEGGVLKPVATQEWVGQNYVSAAFFNAIFQLQDASGNAITPNNATTAKDRLKILVGAYTDQYLSALGLNPNSGGGGGTGDVTWTALAQTATDNRTIDWSYIANAVTQQGYITSALLAAYLTTNGYATQSWVGQQGFLTSQDITANLINNALGFTLSGTSGSTYNLDNFALASALSGYLPLTGGTMTGSLKQEAEIHLYDKTAPSRGYARIRQDDSNGLYISWEDQNVGTALTETLNVDGNIYMDTKLVATQNWVGLNYTDTVTLNTMLGNYLLKSGGTMTGTLYMGVGTYFRLYEDANSYASIYASATDGLSIGFSGGATVAAINLDANTEIGGTLGVTGNITVGHPNTNGGYIQIGGVRLVYDSTNNALYVVSSDGSTAANFYTTGGNSALGYSPSGSGGGGTGDVTWTALAAQATNNRTIHSSYIADTLANYLLISGGTVTGDLTLLGNVFATSAAFNINHLYLTTGFVVQMVDRLNNNQSAFAFDANNNFVFSLGTHNAKFIASDLLVGTNTVWHGGNFPLSISSPTSGQVLKFNGTSWVNDAAPTGGGTVTSITLIAGTGISLDVDNTAITTSGSRTINISSTYQTYISHGESAYNSLSSYLPLSGGTISGNLVVTGTLNVGDPVMFGDVLTVNDEIFMNVNERVATENWVTNRGYTSNIGTVTSITAGTGLSGGTITGSGTIAIDSTYQTYISNGNTAYGWGNHANAGYALASALASYLPLSAGTSYPITGALCLSALNEIRLYQDSTHYAKITPDTSDGLTIAFSAGNTMNQLNLPTNTYIGSDIVASQTWVGQQGFAYASQIPTVPTAVSAFTNDAGYITSSALNGYATQTWVGQQGYITSSSISDMATMTWVVNQDYVSTSDLNTTLSSYALTSQIPTNNNQLTNGAGYITGSALSGYATESWVQSQGYITSVAGYVPKRENGYSYNNLASYYSQWNSVEYIRVHIPKTDVWCMTQLTFSLFKNYSYGQSAKIIVTGYCYGDGLDWHSLTARVIGNVNVEVYGSDREYIYIHVSNAYQVLTLDKALFADSITSSDVSNVTIDAVSSLPSSYVAATMYYDIHSQNIGSQSVNYATSAGTASSATTASTASTANYATSAGYSSNSDTVDNEHASAFAHIGQWNNLLCEVNEFNFISNGFSGTVWLNYEDGNRNGGSNVTDYCFGNGARSANANLRCGGVYGSVGSFSSTLTVAGGISTPNGVNISCGGSVSAAGGISCVSGFTKANCDNTSVLLAGGGHLALSSFLTNPTTVDLTFNSGCSIYMYQDSSHRSRIYSDTDGLNVSFDSGATTDFNVSGDISADGNIYAGSSLVATRSWVSGLNVSTFNNDAGYITSSGSCAYATSAGTANDPYKLPIAQANNPQNPSDNNTWGMTYAESNRQSFVYNTNGEEWAYWIGMRSSDVSYGTILRLSHAGQVQYAHKAGGGAGENWSGWKNIITQDNIGSQSVNYATSAGSVSNADTVDSEHASAFAHRGQWNNLLTSGNEFNFISNGFSGEVWFNWQDGNRQSAANISDYHLGNGRSGYSRLVCSGVVLASSNTSAHVLTTDGGFVAISSLSVNSASYANNADTVDGLHASAFLRHMQVSSPQDTDYGSSMVSWAENYAETNISALVYNSYGTEWSYLMSMNDNIQYGAIVKFGYGDTYLRIHRKNVNWISSDWEKISAGYADSAGSASSADYATNAGTVGNWSVSDILSNSFNSNAEFKNDANTVVTSGAYAVSGSHASNYPSGFTGGECVVFRNSSLYANAQLAFNTSDSTMWFRTGYGDPNNISWNSWTGLLTNPMTTHLSFNSSCDIRMYDDSTHYTSIHEDSDGLNIGFANSNSNGNLVVAGGIENTGSVTVGNTLTVNGTTTSVGNIYGSNSIYIENYIQLKDTRPQGGGAFYWGIRGNGYGVMEVSGGTQVAFYMSVAATSFQQTSDARKKNISDYDVEPNLWDIAYAPAIRYTWKEGQDKANHVGSLAQYWKAILPEAVTESFDGYLGMQYDVIALLSAISIAKKTVEHERRISELERRVGTLESENSYLRSQINELKAA